MFVLKNYKRPIKKLKTDVQVKNMILHVINDDILIYHPY